MSEKGTKHDQGKLRYDLISGVGLRELAKVYTFGATKYAEHNWRKGLRYSRLFGAAMRHAWSWFAGERDDAETGCHHLASVAWCCLALIEFDLTNRRELDDRWTSS